MLCGDWADGGNLYWGARGGLGRVRALRRGWAVVSGLAVCGKRARGSCRLGTARSEWLREMRIMGQQRAAGLAGAARRSSRPAPARDSALRALKHKSLS